MFATLAVKKDFKLRAGKFVPVYNKTLLSEVIFIITQKFNIMKGYTPIIMLQKEFRLKHVQLSYRYKMITWISKIHNERSFAASFFLVKVPGLCCE